MDAPGGAARAGGSTVSVPPELAQVQGDGGSGMRLRAGRTARDALPQSLGDAGERLLLPLALQQRSAPESTAGANSPPQKREEGVGGSVFLSAWRNDTSFNV